LGLKVIRLLAIDSKMVNLAILKIAQYHINLGDNVNWYEPLFDQICDILYISKIFTFSDDINYLPQAQIIKGGTGYDVHSQLPIEIENITNINDAYELLYPKMKYSIIFTTRGCVRNCDFCLVRKKEGLTHDVPITSLHPNSEFIEVLDNNFFSSSTWHNRINYLKSLDLPLNFNTGIDVRTITEEQANELSKCKLKMIHIAWDYIGHEKMVRAGIERLLKYVSSNKVTCYVLVGFTNKLIIKEDVYRVLELHKYKIRPFAMGYIDFYNKKDERTDEVKWFQRWVNRFYYKNVSWENYNYKEKSLLKS